MTREPMRARTLVRNAAHREITGGAGGEGGLRASYFKFFYVNGTPRAHARARVTAQPNLSGLGRKMNRADLCSVKSGRERETPILFSLICQRASMRLRSRDGVTLYRCDINTDKTLIRFFRSPPSSLPPPRLANTSTGPVD